MMNDTNNLSYNNNLLNLTSNYLPNKINSNIKFNNISASRDRDNNENYSPYNNISYNNEKLSDSNREFTSISIKLKDVRNKLDNLEKRKERMYEEQSKSLLFLKSDLKQGLIRLEKIQASNKEAYSTLIMDIEASITKSKQIIHSTKKLENLNHTKSKFLQTVQHHSVEWLEKQTHAKELKLQQADEALKIMSLRHEQQIDLFNKQHQLETELRIRQAEFFKQAENERTQTILLQLESNRQQEMTRLINKQQNTHMSSTNAMLARKSADIPYEVQVEHMMLQQDFPILNSSKVIAESELNPSFSTYKKSLEEIGVNESKLWDEMKLRDKEESEENARKKAEAIQKLRDDEILQRKLLNEKKEEENKRKLLEGQEKQKLKEIEDQRFRLAERNRIDAEARAKADELIRIRNEDAFKKIQEDANRKVLLEEEKEIKKLEEEEELKKKRLEADRKQAELVEAAKKKDEEERKRVELEKKTFEDEKKRKELENDPKRDAELKARKELNAKLQQEELQQKLDMIEKKKQENAKMISDAFKKSNPQQTFLEAPAKDISPVKKLLVSSLSPSANISTLLSYQAKSIDTNEPLSADRLGLPPPLLTPSGSSAGPFDREKSNNSSAGPFDREKSNNSWLSTSITKEFNYSSNSLIISPNDIVPPPAVSPMGGAKKAGLVSTAANSGDFATIPTDNSNSVGLNLQDYDNNPISNVLQRKGSDKAKKPAAFRSDSDDEGDISFNAKPIINTNNLKSRNDADEFDF